MDADRLVTSARIARMATVDPNGRPHLVPIVFAFVDGTIYTSVDGKPKRTTALRRLENIRADSRVSILVDHYEEDWDNLWWIRVDGTAEILEHGSAAAEHALDALAEKYPQYALTRTSGPVIAIRELRWRSWSGEGTASMDEELA